METRNSVKWCRGMLITPSTFEAADKFEIAMHHIGRQIVTHRLFGVLPTGNMNISTSLNDNIISVKINELEAVNRAGESICIKNDSVTLKLPNLQNSQCYVALYREGVVEQELNGILFNKDAYNYEICALDNIDAYKFPIVKLVQSDANWEVLQEYIPPILSLNTHSYMMRHLSNTQALVREILEQLAIKYPSLKIQTLKTCAIELNDYYGAESPEEYHHLLHKIVSILSWSNLFPIEQPQPSNLLFNQNDILNSILLLEQCIYVFYEHISNEDIKQKEPEPIELYVEL